MKCCSYKIAFELLFSKHMIFSLETLGWHVKPATDTITGLISQQAVYNDLVCNHVKIPKYLVQHDMMTLTYSKMVFPLHG